MKSNNICAYCKHYDTHDNYCEYCCYEFLNFEGLDVELVVHGKWIVRNSIPMTWECTNCGGRTLLFNKPYKYCPHCGAITEED